MITTVKQIAEYWIKNFTVEETDLNFDWADCRTHCWNCGADKQSKSNKNIVRVQRAHIVPHSLGGEDIPSNYVLLCSDCHKEAPNTSNKEDMWDWIKSNHLPMAFSGTYRLEKGLILFKQKEGYSFFDKALHIKNLTQVIKNEYNNVSTHGAFMNESTYYYMFKSIIDKYAK